MLEALSHVEKAYRDTLIRCVEGREQITNLSRIFGLNYPQGFNETSWRKALRAAAYGRRGTIPQIFDFLSGLTDHHTRDILVQATSATRLTSATNEFATDDYSRFIRLLSVDSAIPPRPYEPDHTGPLHFSIAVGPSGSYIDLANVSTSYWDRPDVTIGTRYYARVYPFTFAEPTPGRPEPSDSGSGYIISKTQKELACKLIVSFMGTLSTVPPTYMVASAVDRADPAEPDGGHLQPDELTEQDIDDPNHAYPPYMSGSTLGKVAQDSLDLLLASGVQAIAAASY